MGPTWGRQDPGGPHVGYMNFGIWDISLTTGDRAPINVIMEWGRLCTSAEGLGQKGWFYHANEAEDWYYSVICHIISDWTENFPYCGGEQILLSTIIMLHHVTHLPLPSLLSLIRKQDITLPVLQSYHIWADACTYITNLNISSNTVKYPGVPKRYSWSR